MVVTVIFTEQLQLFNHNCSIQTIVNNNYFKIFFNYKLAPNAQHNY